MKLKALNYVHLIFGVILSGYGMLSIFKQEISAPGGMMKGPGWEILSTPAIFGGMAIMLAFGIAIIYFSVTTKT